MSLWGMLSTTNNVVNKHCRARGLQNALQYGHLYSEPTTRQPKCNCHGKGYLKVSYTGLPVLSVVLTVLPKIGMPPDTGAVAKKDETCTLWNPEGGIAVTICMGWPMGSGAVAPAAA